MAGKGRAAKAGAGAWATGKAVRSNVYVQRLVEDEELRQNLMNAFESVRKAYSRANGKGPVSALDDRKVQRELRRAANSLSEASSSFSSARKRPRRRRRGGLLLVMIVGAAAAIALSEDLRKRVLDLLFGAEEEFEYTSTTTPPPPVPSEATGPTTSS